MKVQFTKTLAAALAMSVVPVCGYAKTGAPHTVKAQVSFDNVALSWLSPSAKKRLCWHDGKDYNGDSAPVTNPQKSVKSYAGAKFTAADLVNSVGEKIQAVEAFAYRPVAKMTALVYEDGVVVASANADMTKFKKNTFMEIPLAEPVEIKAGKEYLFAVCYEHGGNMDFVAIKDVATEAHGKSDLFSADGKNWVATNNGDYLVGAILANDVDEAPASYNVYDGETLLTPAPVTDTSLTLEAQAQGKHSYVVEAVYDGATHKAAACELTTRAYSSYAPTATFGASSVSDLDVSLAWSAPLTDGTNLTWCKTADLAQAIGGTAASNTKVWVRNSFDASDLIAFSGAKITAVNYMFNEAVMSKVTAWVMEDDVLVSSADLTAEQVAAINALEWVKIPLTDAVEIKPGHSYSYGLYVLHTPKKHPMGIDGSPAVNVKGNSFSTSSPNSTDFLKSKPSWKTLAQGGIAGNWMLTADVEGGKALSGTVTYDLSRNGETIASGLSTLAYNDAVSAPGAYKYALTAKIGDLVSEEVTKEVSVALPAAYAAPLLEDAQFDKTTGDISLAWSTDKPLSHYGTPSYMVGFDEEMDMMWGAQFSAEELGAYEGLELKSLKFAVGEAVGNLKVGVYTTKGTPLAEIDLSGETIEPLAFYNAPLPTPVKITGTQDLVLAYSGKLAAGSSPIILDEGPLAAGGARVSLTGGATWMNLGTVNATYNNYNIVIAGVAGDSDNTDADVLVVADEVGKSLAASVAAVESRELGVEADKAVVPHTTKTATRPRAATFRVYCNGEVVASTAGHSYEGKIPGFGKFVYNVTAVYENGWESPASQSVSAERNIAQKAKAPFGLSGQLNSDGGADLSWQSPDQATVLTYNTTPITNGFGLTGSNIETYAAQKFPAADLENHVGKKISHITFGLLDNNLTSLEAIVVVDENVMYRQEVDVNTLVKGVNDVRLNEPYEIVPGQNIGIGYHAVYASGVKPIACDAGPAVVNWGDLYSKSATPGYWYSCKTKNKFDWNIYASAILAAPDSELEVKTQDASDITYNVYCNGQLVAQGLTTPAYTTEAKAYGTYHVTAVDATGESGESNSFTFKDAAGVDNIITDNGDDADARYYNLQGVEVNRDNAAPGLYLRRSAAGTTKVIIR